MFLCCLSPRSPLFLQMSIVTSWVSNSPWGYIDEKDTPPACEQLFSIHAIQRNLWGWRGASAVKSTGCSRGLVPSTYMATHNCL